MKQGTVDEAAKEILTHQKITFLTGAVSKNIGKHNARVYQSNGGNWDEVASGILGKTSTSSPNTSQTTSKVV